jgi:hypothetical protein
VNGQDPSQVVRRECDISVDHLYKWALSGEEVDATPGNSNDVDPLETPYTGSTLI